MKLVLIEWIDSRGSNGWQLVKDIAVAAKVANCRSVGWLMDESGGRKLIVPHLSGEDGEADWGLGDLSIPNQAVVKMHVLRR